MNPIHSVALIGLGAIGCSLAPGQQKAVGDQKLRVIAGGTRKKRLETDGVIINGTNYHFNIINSVFHTLKSWKKKSPNH